MDQSARPIAKSDGNGLTFTLSAKGTAAWVLRYRFAGKARELTLRPVIPETSRLRRRASEPRSSRQGDGRHGRCASKRQVKIERAAAQSFSQLAAELYDQGLPPARREHDHQRRRTSNRSSCRGLGVLPAREVSTADVCGVGGNRRLQRSKNVAELVRTAISEIFKPGFRDMSLREPVRADIPPRDLGKPEPRRKRLMLTDEDCGPPSSTR